MSLNFEFDKASAAIALASGGALLIYNYRNKVQQGAEFLLEDLHNRAFNLAKTFVAKAGYEDQRPYKPVGRALLNK